MLANDLPVLNEAAETIYRISQNEQIRERCEAREDFFRRQRTTEHLLQLQQNELEKQRKQLSEKDQQLTEKDQQLTEKDQQLTEKDQQLTEKDQQIERMKKILLANRIEI